MSLNFAGRSELQTQSFWVAAWSNIHRKIAVYIHMRETDTDTDTEIMQQSKCPGHDHFWCRECGSFANADCRAATRCCMQQQMI
jgi:hypothetical protein